MPGPRPRGLGDSRFWLLVKSGTRRQIGTPPGVLGYGSTASRLRSKKGEIGHFPHCLWDKGPSWDRAAVARLRQNSAFDAKTATAGEV